MKAKKIFIIGVMFLCGMLTACGNSSEDTPLLDQEIERMKSGDKGQDKENERNMLTVSVSDKTVEMLSSKKDSVVSALTKYGLEDTEGRWYAKLTAEQHDSLLTEAYDLLDSETEKLSSNNMSITVNVIGGSMSITCDDTEDIRRIETEINELAVIEGVCERISNSKENWSVIISIYCRDESGNTVKYGSASVMEDYKFSFKDIYVLAPDPGTVTDANAEQTTD